MRTMLPAFAAILIFSTAMGVAQEHDATNLPAQAQASAMAVPEPAPSYVSALLVVHCRKVEALVLIDEHGEQHPYHGKEATLAQVLTMLSPVPADKVTQVTITCPGELGL